jgi:hypothetical protein
MPKPARMFLHHLRSGITLQAMYNPQQVEEALTVVWGRLSPLGASGQPMQYQRTSNLTVPLALTFDAHSTRSVTPGVLKNAGVPGLENLRPTEFARRFLLASCYGPRGAESIQGTAPSRMLLIWPNMWQLAARITEVKIAHTKFETTLASQIMTASLKLEYESLVRITWEDVMEKGFIRDGVGAQP